jgi:hypothetical protein
MQIEASVRQFEKEDRPKSLTSLAYSNTTIDRTQQLKKHCLRMTSIEEGMQIQFWDSSGSEGLVRPVRLIEGMTMPLEQKHLRGASLPGQKQQRPLGEFKSPSLWT